MENNFGFPIKSKGKCSHCKTKIAMITPANQPGVSSEPPSSMLGKEIDGAGLGHKAQQQLGDHAKDIKELETVRFIVIVDSKNEGVSFLKKEFEVCMEERMFEVHKRIRGQLCKEWGLSEEVFHVNHTLHLFSTDLGTSVSSMLCLRYMKEFGLDVVVRVKTIPGEIVKIVVKQLLEDPVSVQVPLFATVAHFKFLIQQKTDHPWSVQRLLFAGQQLNDDRTLVDYGLKNDGAVHLILLLRGGGGNHGHRFTDMSNLDAIIKLKFASSGPKWRQIAAGLNLEAKCLNDSCNAYNELVCVPWGFRSFDLCSQDFGIICGESPRCPNCREPVQPTSCGFIGCLWRFMGQKTGGGPVLLKSPWRVADADSYTTFHEENDTILWDKLLIQVSEPVHIQSASTRSLSLECAICLAPMPMCEGIPYNKKSFGLMDQGNEDDRIILPCGHHDFHRGCIKLWLKSRRRHKPSCPFCRNRK